MYLLITIFYLSFAGMATMVLLKRREILSGQGIAASGIGQKIDRSFQAVWSAFGHFVAGFNRRNLIAVVQLVAYHILLRVRRVYVELKHRTLMNPHGRKVIDAVRGRGEIRNHGASFYLRRIGDK